MEALRSVKVFVYRKLYPRRSHREICPLRAPLPEIPPRTRQSRCFSECRVVSDTCARFVDAQEKNRNYYPPYRTRSIALFLTGATLVSDAIASITYALPSPLPG